ncbi:MAG TPA: alpha/beta hydrolase [Verrucomicrobiae bacterium]|jgi:pimeloyl-ACP methyl ester carboxylesterase|nr:alpha/beta hydrolase [Verrucomicrobiae bacterium]
MDAKSPGKSSAARVIVSRLTFLVLLLTLALGIVVWRAPLWVGAEVTLLRLLADGFHKRSMLMNGYHVFYLEGGPESGTPVVLIHGLGSKAQQDWVALAPYLVRAGYHVYAMDLLGYGRSAKPPELSYSIREEAKFVESFLDVNHLTSVALGGESMGGWIAATVALDRPDLVKRLMLFDSAGMKFQLSFDQAIFTPQTSEQVDQLMAEVTPNAPRLPQFVKADYIRKTKRYGWVTQRALASMTTGADDLDGKFSALKMPLLIVWGKQDAMTPLSLGESMHRAAPQSTLAIYDGCGHIAVVTCINQIAPTVLNFLSGAGPEPGKTIEAPARKHFLMP